MSQASFRAALSELAAELAGRPLDDTLDAWLNLHHGADSPTFTRLAEAIRTGVAEGWLCQREGGGIRYGRIFKAADDLAGCSVDVVDMSVIAGPHHHHSHKLLRPVLKLAKLAFHQSLKDSQCN
jgi:hypothetical protein